MQNVYADKKEDLKDQLNDIEKKKDAKEKDMDKIEKKVNPLKNKLKKVETGLEEIREDSQKIENELKLAQKQVDRYGKEYRKSVRNMYINGHANGIASLFASASIMEFLARFQYLRLIVKSDFHVVEKFYRKKEKVEKKKNELDHLTQQLKKEEAKSKQAYTELAKEMKTNKDSLAKLEHQEEITKEDLAELNLSHLKAGNFPYQGPLSRPVGGGVTSGYGGRGGEFHTGIDFGGGIGTPIKAAANGRVVRSQGCNCGYGYYIVIDHGGGVFTLYAHMWASTARVLVGDVVRKGQHIADIGNNGRSTGPHLHFEVHKGSPGNHVNPYSYMK